MNPFHRDFYTLYDIEALEFATKKRKASFWVVLLQASFIFIVITIIVFCIANYQFIKSQLVAWNVGRTANARETEDKNSNGLPDWWEEQYGLAGDDPKLKFQDNDSDGLNNWSEYEYSTNPVDVDTDKDGYPDGRELQNGYDPNGAGRLDRDKDLIADWWETKYGLNCLDKEDALADWDQDQLTNQQEFVYLTDPRSADSDRDGTFDGQEARLGTDPMGQGMLQKVGDQLIEDTDQDKLEDFFERLFGTDPAVTDSDADNFDDFRELTRGYDPTDPSDNGRLKAELVVPKINVTAPIVWSSASQNQSEQAKLLNADLENGIVHYPGTTFPGRRGNAYLTGHSSYYAWSQSRYKDVLKQLGELGTGDKIMVRTYPKSGQQVDIIYKVKSAEAVAADDPRLFRDYEGYEMTLVTCWPVGTDWKRWMVKAELESPRPE